MESRIRGEQYQWSLSVPKNARNLKGFNQVQATEKAGLVKLFQVAYLTALKGSPY